ncbi:MAG: response regulator, partial [Deltaproteobacteria bacterium]
GAILLVDDERMLRNMAAAILESMGFYALTAQDGVEALEIFRERGSEINMILLDLIMPQMGGIETYHELRKIAATIPIIICSGYSVDEVSDVIAHDEYAGFVQKPYKPEQLRAAMVRMMGQKTMSEAL